MFYTRLFPFLLIGLTGCAGLSSQGVGSGNAAPTDPGAIALAEKEIASFQQAITALNKNELDRAESELRTLTKSRPELAGPWVNLALIDIKRKNFDGAQKNLTKALERNPKLAQAYNLLGYIETAKGNMKQAVEHYQKAITLKKDYAMAYYNLGLLNDIYLHDVSAAVQNYKRYLELTNHEDKKTAEWVAELERNLSKRAQ